VRAFFRWFVYLVLSPALQLNALRWLPIRLTRKLYRGWVPRTDVHRFLRPEEISTLVGRDDPLILEIGANDGTTTEAIINRMPGATLFCFEPDPRPRERFRKRIRSPRCHLISAAISDRDGMIELRLSGGRNPKYPSAEVPWDASSSIKKPTGHLQAAPWCRFDDRVQVPVVTLDSWCGQRGIMEVDFIWADVQGAEGEMLAGGEKTFKRHVRYLYTEFSNQMLFEDQLDLDGILRCLPGYVVVGVFANNVLLRNSRYRRGHRGRGARALVAA
jgi:FkbM family methyltransferase